MYNYEVYASTLGALIFLWAYIDTVKIIKKYTFKSKESVINLLTSSASIFGWYFGVIINKSNPDESFLMLCASLALWVASRLNLSLRMKYR
jgi:hypothetical protein